MLCFAGCQEDELDQIQTQEHPEAAAEREAAEQQMAAQDEAEGNAKWLYVQKHLETIAQVCDSVHCPFRYLGVLYYYSDVDWSSIQFVQYTEC